MKNTSLVFLAALTLSAQAMAGGPNNVNGLVGRLESITCRSAYTTTLSAFNGKIANDIQAACKGAADGSPDADACMKAQIKRLLQPAPQAVFVGAATPNDVTFDLSIVDGGKTAFHSVRKATHGDTADSGSTLIFESPAGLGDQYMIESDPISEDSNSVAGIIVPVHRRILADLVYVFVDGCSLSWTGLQQPN